MMDRDVDKVIDIYKIVVKLSRRAQLMAEESGLVFQLGKDYSFSTTQGLHWLWSPSNVLPIG
jgi:hypothetical protein